MQYKLWLYKTERRTMYKYFSPIIIFAIFFSPFNTCYSQDNNDLSLLYREDQNERLVKNIDWPKLIKQDSIRRAKVIDLIKLNKLNTSNDYFHAAMIFQHGNDSASYKMAFDLAKKACLLDTTNRNARWLTAASYDRYLLSKGQPQVYGPQFAVINNRYYLQEIDTTKVTDSVRIYYGTRTLQKIKGYLTEMNGEDNGLLIYHRKKSKLK